MELPPNIRRVHVTGGAGSGKTRLAARLAKEQGIPHHDLDGLALARVPLGANPVGPEAASRLIAQLTPEIEVLAASEAWVSDGSYVTWIRPLFERADLIVHLDIPWRVAAYRIVVRHLKAELARENRFPGWRRMLRFWHYSRRYYNDTNGDGANDFGNPRTRRFLNESLAPYAPKVVVCRTTAEAEELLARVSRLT